MIYFINIFLTGQRWQIDMFGKIIRTGYLNFNMIDHTGIFFVGLLVTYAVAQHSINVPVEQFTFNQLKRNPIDLGPVNNHQMGGINTHHLFTNMMIDEAEKKRSIDLQQPKGSFTDKDKGILREVEILPRNAISYHIPTA
jgi:hypothetical protein